MKTIILLCAVLSTAFSAPSGTNYYAGVQSHAIYYPQQVKEIPAGPIITGTMHHSQDTYGQYKYGYSSSDGQGKEESRNTEGDIDGKFSYISPEGHQIALSYEAGESGFQATGSHLPVAPEMPEELAAAYKQSNERLIQAYQEALLRGDTETSGAWMEEGMKQDNQNQEMSSTSGYTGYPMPTYQVTNYQNQQTYQVPAASTHQTQYINKEMTIPSYPTNTYYTTANLKAEENKATFPYLSTSYSTEIGGTPAVMPIIQETVQEMEAPKMNYAYKTPNYYNY